MFSGVSLSWLVGLERLFMLFACGLFCRIVLLFNFVCVV